ncbi:MAG: signal peptide peptidase SppA [Crocinitomicaceae bacterium]
MTFWKTFFASLLAIVVSGILLIGLFFIIISSLVSGIEGMSSEKPKYLGNNSILHMELNQKIGDVSYSYLDQNSFQIVEQIGLMDILEAIKGAKTDDRIEGIYLNVANVNCGMGILKDIREALADFKTTGKFIVSYHENYGNKSYYLSSVADEVYIYPTGMFGVTGLGVEIPFLKGTLDMLGVDMQIIRGSNNKFKSAVEPLMYTEMSEANRLQTQKYMDALWREITKVVEVSRGVSEAEMNRIVDSVLTRTPQDAVDLKLADGVKYYDEIETILKAKTELKADDDLKLYSFKSYLKKHSAHTGDASIAVISLEGEIVDGMGGPGQIGGTSSAELVRKARKDSTIKVVVLRVNSPGGSALASDLIWREVELTKTIKPVVVSMGDVAASGGYYVSCGANRIFAQENTITGSIGVFGIIPYTGDFMKEKIGVSFDHVKTNAHSVLSLNKRLTESELKIIQQGVDDIYNDFISKVGAGRGKTTAEIDSIGQGRVWAGTDAISIGLIDEFGGLDEAIAHAAKLVDLPADKVETRIMTTNKNDKLVEFMQNLNQEQALVKTGFETKLMEMYKFVKQLESSKGVQARIPYLYWID